MYLKFLVLLLVINKLAVEANTIIAHKKKIVEIEKKLLQKLLTDYDKKLRPSDTVEVRFSLYLNQIITLIEQEQIVVLNVFLDHEWIDERLAWNPDEFDNITLLRMSSDYLWT